MRLSQSISLIVILLICSPSVLCTLSKNDNKKNKSPKTSAQPKSGAISQSAEERKLVTKSVSAAAILSDYRAYSQATDDKKIPEAVLGYVTPWNNHGYDIAKIFANKFSMISPVWLQVKPKSDGKGYEVTGLHDVDQGWMKTVRKNGKASKTKIVPRLLFDGWSGNDYIQLFSQSSRVRDLCDTIANAIKSNKMDGIVLELWSQLGGYQSQHLINVIRQLGKKLRESQLTFVLVIPPSVYHGNAPGMFGSDHFDQLVDYVDYFSLMTYDYSNAQRPGPNSPLQWIKTCVQNLDPESLYRHKILTGFNFYGNDYSISGGGPIVGSQYVDILEKHGQSLKFQWDDESKEHFFEYK